MVDRETVLKVHEILDGEDFILIVRAPCEDGSNCGAQLVTNVSSEEAMRVVTKFAEAHQEGDTTIGSGLNG